MKLSRPLTLGFAALCLVLALETFTNTDVWLQNYFYDAANMQWLINPLRHKELTVFFYDGLKRALMIFAACCLLNLLLSIKIGTLRQYNHFCVVMLLSFILVPTIVAGAKYYTNVYCPYQLDIYNGAYPFVRVLESYPADFVQTKIGKCFPAGHATAGFAFMGLFYAFRQRANRRLGLAIGLGLGWMAGIYQMLRGQHFLSHTLFSMIASFMLIMVAAKLTELLEHKFPQLLRKA